MVGNARLYNTEAQWAPRAGIVFAVMGASLGAPVRMDVAARGRWSLCMPLGHAMLIQAVFGRVPWLMQAKGNTQSEWALWIY